MWIGKTKEGEFIISGKRLVRGKYVTTEGETEDVLFDADYTRILDPDDDYRIFGKHLEPLEVVSLGPLTELSIEEIGKEAEKEWTEGDCMVALPINDAREGYLLGYQDGYDRAHR